MDRVIENVIEWVDGNETATVTFSSRYRNKLLKLAEKHPDEVTVLAKNEDGSIYGRVPLSWVTIRRPKRMDLTEEQRKAIADRLANYRKS